MALQSVVRSSVGARGPCNGRRVPLRARVTGAAAVHYRRCASIVAITPEIEGDERFIPAGRPLENFGMAERTHGVIVTSPPVLLHRAARELVGLGIALVTFRPIAELHDVGGVSAHSP